MMRRFNLGRTGVAPRHGLVAMRIAGLTLGLAAVVAMSGCSDAGWTGNPQIQQTQAPGHIMAGGGSSGAVLGRSAKVGVTDSPAGTPGIPQGAGGTTSGAALGGTVVSAGPAGNNAQSQAEREKQQLATSMEAVSQRWRNQASKNGWTTHPPTPVDAVAGFNASANQSSASGQPGGRIGSDAAQAPASSEKSGTAAPGSDVKDDSMRRAMPGVRANAPDQVK